MTRAVALALVLAACSAPPKLTTPDKTAPAWFVGAWKLEWVEDTETPRGLTRFVRDLQTPTVFGSVRIPFDRPAFPKAKSFDDLDDSQLAALVAMPVGGFSGTASFENNIAVWTHAIAFQPPDRPDTARLKPQSPSTVLETGQDGGFAELWFRMSSGDGKYLGLVITQGKRVEKILTLVGDHFVYARNRKADLPRAESMAKLVESMKATRAQIIETLDCELSYGLVHGGRIPWEIRHSTLPWREGTSLDFVREVTVDANGPVLRDGWTVPLNTFAPEDLAIIFPEEARVFWGSYPKRELRLFAWRHPGFSAHVGEAILFEHKRAMEDVA